MRGTRSNNNVASDAETISMRQAWHFAHNCGLLGAKVSLARLNEIAVKCRRSEDDLDEEVSAC